MLNFARTTLNLRRSLQTASNYSPQTPDPYIFLALSTITCESLSYRTSPSPGNTTCALDFYLEEVCQRRRLYRAQPTTSLFFRHLLLYSCHLTCDTLAPQTGQARRNYKTISPASRSPKEYNLTDVSTSPAN